MALDELAYIVWFHKMFGSTKRGVKLLSFYGGDYERFYEAVINGEDKTGITEKMPEKKFRDYSPVDADKELGICEMYGWEVISCKSPLYPKELAETDSYPHILFCDGNTEILSRAVKFAVVGSREAHPDAEVITRNAAYNLAKTGAVIVSGAAMGIDSCAHLGAIEGGGETIGVLGCGLGSEYMDKIGSFYEKVKENGVYVTEMFPFQNASRYSFPERNRLISGMSKAVLVACAAENSGSLITAETAKKQHRRVYAFAPEICFSTGGKKLIDEGAYVFYNAGDIAYPFRDFYESGKFNDSYCNNPVNNISSKDKEDMAIPKKAPVKKSGEKNKTEEKINKKTEVEACKVRELPDTLSSAALTVYRALGASPEILDHLVIKTGLKITDVLIAVSELETELLIKSLPGSRIEKI